jgi:hypothetical protein
MYKIAIPSYKREEQLKDKTLRVLEKYQVPPDRVYIFVANEEERERYEKALAGHLYNNIHVAVPTIGAARNFIEQEFFSEGEYVVSLDDDLTGIHRWVDEKTLVEVDDFEKELIVAGYEAMQTHGTKCWGIYAAANPYFMSEGHTTKLCYIIASCYGFIVEHDDFLRRETNHGEDYEYSIRQYIKNGKVFRFNNYTVKTKYFGTGGLEEFRNNKYIYDSIRKIEKMFPKHCTLYFRKGRAELKMKG